MLRRIAIGLSAIVLVALSCFIAVEIDRAARGVLLYLYAMDLVSLRAALVSAGKNPGPIQYPDYLPKGEFAIEDPDGYIIAFGGRPSAREASQDPPAPWAPSNA